MWNTTVLFIEEMQLILKSVRTGLVFMIHVLEIVSMMRRNMNDELCNEQRVIDIRFIMCIWKENS